MKWSARTAVAVSMTAAIGVWNAPPTNPESSLGLRHRAEAALGQERFAKHGVQVIKIISREEDIAAMKASNKTARPSDEAPASSDTVSGPDYVLAVTQPTHPPLGCEDFASTFVIFPDENNDLVGSLAFAGDEQAVSNPDVFEGPAMFGPKGEGTIIHGEVAGLQSIDIASESAPQQVDEINQSVCKTYIALHDPETASTIDGTR